MNSLQIFKNNQFGDLRMMEIDGEPMFVAADITAALGYANGRDAVAKHVDKDDVAKRDTIDSLGRVQSTTIINESGMYSLILSSKLPQAKMFKKWVTSEVLPSIRKRGAYMTDDAVKKSLEDPDYMIKLLQGVKAEREARLLAESEAQRAQKVVEAQQVIIEDNKPKVRFFDIYSQCKGSILIGEMAKLLRQAGVNTIEVLGELKGMGQNNLYAWLRENHYLGLRGEYYNMPTQMASRLAIFDIKNTIRTDYAGNLIPCTTVKINAKGQQYFIDKFLT